MTQAQVARPAPCFAASGVALPLRRPGRGALCEGGARARVAPAARVSVTRRHRARPPRSSPPSAAAPSAAPAAPAAPPPAEAPEERVAERFAVRDAERSELYAVADVRCGAFYAHPREPYFHPMRRREIYTALVERVSTGSRCLVVIDAAPPPSWAPFCARDGSLVVASLDLTQHDASSGQRAPFAFGPPGGGAAAAEGGRMQKKKETKRLYVSSMAVRDDWRRRGLARALLRAVDDIARAAAIDEVFLHVDWDNAPAVALYCKAGFARVAAEKRTVPEWLSFLAKREHTLLRKRVPRKE